MCTFPSSCLIPLTTFYFSTYNYWEIIITWDFILFYMVTSKCLKSIFISIIIYIPCCQDLETSFTTLAQKAPVKWTMNIREAGLFDLFKCTVRCSFFYAVPSISSTASFQGSEVSYPNFYYDMQQMFHILLCTFWTQSPGEQSQGILVLYIHINKHWQERCWSSKWPDGGKANIYGIHKNTCQSTKLYHFFPSESKSRFHNLLIMSSYTTH